MSDKPDRSIKHTVAITGGILVLVVGFFSGLAAAEQAPFIQKGAVIRDIRPAPGDGLEPSATSTPDLEIFWEAWDLINKNYLENGTVSEAERVRGATAGLVASLGDPYSEYFPPENAESFREDVVGNFGGIGAQLGMRDGQLTIISPLKGSPAEKAGLRPGDRILLVDATSTDPLTVEQAVNVIRGPIDSEVELTIMREGWEEPREFTIVRQEIALPTLDYEIRDDGVIYVQLYQFNSNANRQFFNAIRSGALGGGKGVLLDLRGNPGGFLDVAVDLAGWFLPRGSVVVSQQGRGGETEEVLRANGNAALADIPTVVLIDEGSASASEILAGALRDHRQIPLVGQPSFGKGTVQELEDLSDGSLLKLTVAHWVLPSGQVLEDHGLDPDPDHLVEFTEEDAEAGRDPQFDRALEVLKEIMSNR